jgi:Mg-chelatase subunit ChlD
MNKYINKKKAILLLVVLSVYVVIITPLLVVNLQKQQELRGRAQITTPTPKQNQAAATCGNVPTDIELIIDRSGSMGQSNKINEAKDAAKKFIDVMSLDSRNKIGLVSFSTTANLDISLTDNYTQIKNKVDSLSSNGYTCIECAIKKANQDIASNGRQGIKKAVILLTDGIANHIESSSSDEPAPIAEQKALDAVKDGFNTNKTTFFTIGFGSDVNKNFLQQIATLTGAKYYFPAPTELDAVYQEISQIIAKGIIGGFVFNDVNGNGAFDPTEAKQAGWTLQLTASSGTTSIVSDSTGVFNFVDLCDGNYTLKEVPQTGWQQTLPADPNGYSLSIINGISFTDKNFGNKIAPPTPTPTPQPTATPTLIPTSTPLPTPTLGLTQLQLTIYEHSIWNSGDNTNPTGTNLSNKNPLHKTITTDVQVYNTNNQIVSQGQGSLEYASTSGNFQGLIGITPNTFQSGKYYVKVKTNIHLRRLVPGILTITAGQKNTIPAATLVTGDSNNDNQLNILDYNSLLDCYSDLAVATTCNYDKKDATDFNDDGLVNQIDYNLFLREIATQPGE